MPCVSVPSGVSTRRSATSESRPPMRSSCHSSGAIAIVIGGGGGGGVGVVRRWWWTGLGGVVTFVVAGFAGVGVDVPFVGVGAVSFAVTGGCSLVAFAVCGGT